MDRLQAANHILVVDDDTIFRTRLVRAFHDRAIQADGESSARAAEVALRATPFTHAVFDLRLEDLSGIELINTALTINPTLQIIVLTGYGSIATALEAVKRGATNYLTKPADIESILVALGLTHGESSSMTPSDTPTLEEVEWNHIQRVLVDVGGNVTHAAKQLGIPRRSLQRKLAKIPGRIN